MNSRVNKRLAFFCVYDWFQSTRRQLSLPCFISSFSYGDDRFTLQLNGRAVFSLRRRGIERNSHEKGGVKGKSQNKGGVVKIMQ